MNDKERRIYQKLVRCRDFGTARAADFGSGSMGTQTITAMAAVVAEIDGHSTDEVSAVGDQRQGTESRAQARAALREGLEAVRRTARVMARDVPGIDQKFRVPRSNNDQELLNAARAFVADATPLRAQFIAHEMPVEFLEDLQADIDAMQAAISNQSGGVGSHVAAGAALDDAFSRGLEHVRTFDVIVRNKYADDLATLAEWTSASHTERSPRRSNPETGSTTSPPPPSG